MTYEFLSLEEAESRIATFDRDTQWQWYETVDTIANLPTCE